MRQKAIVLGATGFVGGHLLQQLTVSGAVDAEAFSSSALDLTAPDAVGRLLDVVGPPTVIFMAVRSRGGADRVDAFAADVAAAVTLARTIMRRRVRKVVYFSTVSVYSDARTNLAITEDTEPAPTSVYGVAKLAGESVVRQAASDSGTPLVVLRPCKVYGPGDSSHTYGPVQFVEQIVAGETVRVFGDGLERRDYVHVRDATAVAVSLGLSGATGTFNVASGRSCSFVEMIEMLRAVTDRPFDVVHVPRDRPKVDLAIVPRQLPLVLPAFRFVPIEDGLAETYRYYMAQLSGISSLHG